MMKSKVHYVHGGGERVYNGVQACGTGMSNRTTRRVGTGDRAKVTCVKCQRWIVFNNPEEAKACGAPINLPTGPRTCTEMKPCSIHQEAK